MNEILFRKYAEVILDPTPPIVRDHRLLMYDSGDIKVYYAPFEYVNPEARVVLVGITPGPTQMVNANNEARRALRDGSARSEAMKRAKLTASFSGEPMRSNLIKQLDHWGLQRWLGIDRTESLFGKYASLVQSTSLLRFPTFISDKDYSGNPDMLRNPLLRSLLYENFVEEARQLPNAVFFGLGPKVQKVLSQLVQSGHIHTDQVLSGLLHPSGNNTYRIAYLVGDRRGPLPHATRPEAYDAGRKMFRAYLDK